jgi:hypothetical protein
VTTRPPPPRVLPLLHARVRYEPDAALAGTLAAFDPASGAPLWAVWVWTMEHEPDAPPHPGRCFGRIALGPGFDELLAEDETAVRYLVDRVQRTVRRWPSTEGGR